jgi:hypothetical protein
MEQAPSPLPEKERERYMNLASKVNMKGRSIIALATAIALAGLLLALAESARGARATFPGGNGKITFASNRTSGEGVNNPEGDFEIYTMNRNGTNLDQLTETRPSTSSPKRPRAVRRSPSRVAATSSPISS